MNITFTKMVQDTQNGTGEMDALVDGKREGWIEKICDAEDVGSLQCVWKYTVSEYEATCCVGFDKQSGYDFAEKTFTVAEYGNPRTALAAAKKWIRETLSATVEKEAPAQEKAPKRNLKVLSHNTKTQTSYSKTTYAKKTYTLTVEHVDYPTKTIEITGYLNALRVGKALADMRMGGVLMRDQTTNEARRITPTGGW